MESEVVYYETVRTENTESTFDLVKKKLSASGIKKLVLASTTGVTAKKAVDFF